MEVNQEILDYLNKRMQLTQINGYATSSETNVEKIKTFINSGYKIDFYDIELKRTISFTSIEKIFIWVAVQLKKEEKGNV